MLVRPPSNQNLRDDYFSGDPAFEQAPEKPAEGQTEEAYKKELKAYAEKLERARETGDWSELLIEGKQPTKFVMKQISGDVLRKISDRTQAGDIGAAQGQALAFRCAISSIENFDFKVEHATFADYGKIATVEVANVLDGITTHIVSELGLEAMRRSKGVSPKS